MRQLSVLSAFVVLTVALVFGLNQALGQPSQVKVAPTPFVPGPEATLPANPEGLPDYTDWTAPGIPVPGNLELTDHVVVAGRTIRLPRDTVVEKGAQWAPCTIEQYEPIVQIQVVGETAVSWVRFTPDGDLLRKRVERDVEPLLGELLSVLSDAPRPTPNPNVFCIIIKEKVIQLPEGALLGSAIGDYLPGHTPDGPTSVEVVTYRASRVVFTPDGVLYQSRSVISEDDRDALAPLLSELISR